ncbi:hypothetical protein D1AOALGA4SA_5659, partial [Olavius algarvensis Delta 1 endosymbiont]
AGFIPACFCDGIRDVMGLDAGVKHLRGSRFVTTCEWAVFSMIAALKSLNAGWIW